MQFSHQSPKNHQRQKILIRGDILSFKWKSSKIEMDHWKSKIKIEFSIQIKKIPKIITLKDAEMIIRNWNWSNQSLRPFLMNLIFAKGVEQEMKK